MSRTLKQVINDANPNVFPDAARAVKLGTHLSGASAQVRAVVASDITDLPEGLSAAVILSAYATVGTVTGALAVVAAAPATGECAINPKGDIIFAAADAVTEAELVFIPVTGDVIEEELPLSATGLGTFGGTRKGKLLLSAEVTEGGGTGDKTIVARGAAPAAGAAALTVNGLGVQFNIASASGKALVRYIASPAAGASSAELLTTAQTSL